MKLKPEVKDEGVSREIWYALGVAAALMAKIDKALVVTSLTDGTHNPGSLHPKGLAVDIRVKGLTDEQAKTFVADLNRILDCSGFDVVFEGGVGATPATTGAHAHIEFDPKKGESFFVRGV